MEKIRNEVGDYVKIPKVILATKRVLIMEYLPGYKITSKEALEKFDRRLLAKRVFRLYMTMLVEKEYFHADPHPGNLAIDDKGDLILYDYGIVGKLDDRTKRLLIRAYLAIRSLDAYLLLDILEELGALDANANKKLLARGIELFLRSIAGEEVSYSEIEDFLKVANKVFYKFPLKLPSKLFYSLRTLIVLEGTCRLIDPNFNILQELEEFFEEKRFNLALIVEGLRGRINSVLSRLRINYLEDSIVGVSEGSRSGKRVALVLSILSLASYLLLKDIYLSFLIIILALILLIFSIRS